MATFDIKKFKEHRLRVYTAMMQKISLESIEMHRDSTEHFEKIMKIMNS